MTENARQRAREATLEQIARLFRAYDTPFGLSDEGMTDKAEGYILACKGFAAAAVRKAVEAYVSGSVERKAGKRATLPTSDEFGAQVRAADAALKARGPDGSKEHAPPFGPLWGVKVYELLGQGPDDFMPPPPRFIRSVIDAGGEKGEAYQLHHQAVVGFSAVNAMFQAAADGKGWSVEVRLNAFTYLLDPVPVSSETFKDWRAIHADRGWPWFPPSGKQRVIYLPRDGDALEDLTGRPAPAPSTASAEPPAIDADPWPDELP